MKLVRGNVLALLSAFLWLMPLHAQTLRDFDYDIHLSKSLAILHEPITVDITLKQTNPNKVLLFTFEIKPSSAYRIVNLYRDIDNTLHATHHRYRFILYPLQTGKISINFTLIKHQSDEEKVYFSASGDRDDYKGLSTIDTPIAIKPIILEVKAPPSAVDLVGEFSMHARLDRNQTQALEPVHFTVRIEGSGYMPPQSLPIQFPPEVNVFSAKPHIKTFKSRDTLRYQATYRYALLAPFSFTIPPLTLRAFDPKRQQVYTLHQPPQSVTVHPLDTDTLQSRTILDTNNTPLTLQQQIQSVLDQAIGWLGYLLVFIAGWLSGYIVHKYTPKRSKHTADNLALKIQEAPDHETLLRLLLAHPHRHLRPHLKTLLKHHNKEGTIPLPKLKRRILSTLKEHHASKNRKT